MRILKRIPVRAIAMVSLLLLAAAPSFGLDAKMVRHTLDFRNLDMEVGLYWAQGYTPIGIEVVVAGVDSGFWVLYAGDSWPDVTEWNMERYAGPSRLAAGIENAAKAGWIPMDVAVDEFGDNAYVLYLKMVKGMKEWRLEAAPDEAGLQSIAERNAARGLLPVGVSPDGKQGLEALFVTLPGHAFGQWAYKKYPDLDSLERQLESLGGEGWALFGFLLRDGQAGIWVMK